MKRCNQKRLYIILIVSLVGFVLCVNIFLTGLDDCENIDPVAIVNERISSLQQKKAPRLLQVYGNDEGVIFLKTHKTGSSTLTSIFWRNVCASGIRNCFLPPVTSPGKTWDFSKESDRNLLINGGGSTINKSVGMGGGQFQSFDAWIYHAHYSDQLFTLVPTTKRVISIVRKPSKRFCSAWSWYEHSSKLKMSLSTFIEEASREAEEGLLFNKIWNHLIGGGSLAKKFKYRTGLDATSQELTGSSVNQKMSSEFTSLIDRVVDGQTFLLVTDRFDESLLVLSKIMGWSKEQLLYSKLKTATKLEIVSEMELKKLDELQPYDLALWNLANFRLDQYIQQEFNDEKTFRQQLKDFQELNAEMDVACHEQSLSPLSSFQSKSASAKQLNYTCECYSRDNNLVVKDAWEVLSGTKQKLDCDLAVN